MSNNIVLDEKEIRLKFKGQTIETQRLRIVTANLSEFCADFVCVYHTGGDNSAESMLFTNEEARYLLDLLHQIVTTWEKKSAQRKRNARD